jgi:hypothetical protein
MIKRLIPTIARTHPATITPHIAQPPISIFVHLPFGTCNAHTTLWYIPSINLITHDFLSSAHINEQTVKWSVKAKTDKNYPDLRPHGGVMDKKYPSGNLLDFHWWKRFLVELWN